MSVRAAIAQGTGTAGHPVEGTPLPYRERALRFASVQDTLAGILSLPEGVASPSLGVIVIVGGPQYRVGSHRQFVLLARALAAQGFPVLRFDYRGMGDSGGDRRDFSDVTPDIAAAITALQAELPSVRQVALWGLCDGASAALLYCQQTRDARVGGLCLLNPWVRTEASLARAHVKHYYRDRLMQKDFWAKLLRGQVALAALAGLWRNLRLMSGGGSGSDAAAAGASFQERMAIGWKQFRGGILLMLSGDDYTAREFSEFTQADGSWKGLLEQPRVRQVPLPGTDHTLSDPAGRSLAEAETARWLRAGMGAA